VQEASVIALRRIGDLRDPAAAGSWLRMVVRNVCRMWYRSPAGLPLDAGLAAALPSSEPDPAQVLEQHAMRDWIWHAMEDLPSPFRLVVMLRYFSGVTAYQDIADVCDVPVGTVRSRLNEARGRLARALLASALAASWLPNVEVSGLPGYQAVGYRHLVRGVEQDLADGVGYRLANVVACRDLVLCEFEMLSPAWDPHHCPPGAGWLPHLRSDWVERVRLFRIRGRSKERARAA
jgi:RNA polymerase sigma factor (sigma-70 family)